MLIIRQHQMEVFGQTALKNFEGELVEHLKTFAPKLFEIRGEKCIRKTVQLGMQRAEKYGFTNRGPIRFYVETMFSLGADFDTDPQLIGATEILSKTRQIPNQMERADQLYRKIIEYMAKVMGPDNCYSIAALKRLSRADKTILQIPVGDTHAILNLFKIYYPEKYEYVGEEQLSELLFALTEKQDELASPERWTLLNILKFALGHGITADPLYPWVQETLSSPQFKTEQERVDRLFKRTRTYLKATMQHLG